MRKSSTIITVVVALVIGVAILTSHRGGLAYFSPHTLEYRIQSERTFFTTGIPFYRSYRNRVENPLVTMLIDDGLVSSQPDENDQWELVFHWNGSWRDGDGPLYGIFHRHSDAIIKWSRDNPECAKIYWSEGFRLLRSNNTIDVSTGRAILNHCWRITDLEEMHTAIPQIKAEIAT